MADGAIRASKKRKHFPNSRQEFGRKNKRIDLGRSARRQPSGADENAINDDRIRETSPHTLFGDGGVSSLPGPFTPEEIAAEPRRPKHKVAVLVGYSGTGYKGMQMLVSDKNCADLRNAKERTIEGDLFSAFVHAGAISKANANDPKKNSLVRCARTDKGVHAAGNVVSLKLITEDKDIVERINSHLSPQIRVWGFVKTTGSFNCYQACDSRRYEYLIPTHTFLPPHPQSFLGKKLVEFAKDCNDLDAFNDRQHEVATFWEDVDNTLVKSILSELDPAVKTLVQTAMEEPVEQDSLEASTTDKEAKTIKSDDAQLFGEGVLYGDNVELQHKQGADAGSAESKTDVHKGEQIIEPTLMKEVDHAAKRIRQAILSAKRAYRISHKRLERVVKAFEQYVGTHNFHNFTIDKRPNDPSAKRHIRSFVVDSEPKVIGDTEWLSLKVHGQSFMMHQIRKMVTAAVMIVRCGCQPERLQELMSADVAVSIPKSPGLGLLLERPIFESYNTNLASQFERDPITFDKYDDVMTEFKQREIYERIFREEEEGQQFHVLSGHIDGFRARYYLWVTSKGVEAAAGTRTVKSELSPGQIERGKQHGYDEWLSKRKAQRQTHEIAAKQVANIKAARAVDGTEMGPIMSVVGAVAENADEDVKAESGTDDAHGIDSEDEADLGERGRSDMDG